MKEEPDLRIPKVDEGTLIPRIIHQTFSRRELPDALQRNVDDLKAMNPGWDYRFYDDSAVEQFILSEYGRNVYSLYMRIDPLYGAARADLFRYLIVYRLGGVYLDIKSRFSCPIDQVIQRDEQFIVSQWSNRTGERYEGFGLKPEVADIPGGEFQQWHVIAAPGHPFLRAVLQAVFAGIERYRPWLHGTGKVGVMRLTGPVIYTHTIAPLLEAYPCKFVRTEAEVSLDYSVVPGETHKKLFDRHYSLSEVSVVRLSGYLRLMNAVYQAIRSLRRKVTSGRTDR